MLFRSGDLKRAVRVVRTRVPERLRWRAAVAGVSEAAAPLRGRERFLIEEPVRELVLDLDDTILRREVASAGIAAEISGRPKHIHSIHRKMQRKNAQLAEIYDLHALRVLVDDLRAYASGAEGCGTGLNQAPHAAADAASTWFETPVAIDVVANDSDVNGDDLGAYDVSDPAQVERVAAMLARISQWQKHYGDETPLTVANPKPAAWAPPGE